MKTIRTMLDSGELSLDTVVLGELPRTADGAIIGDGSWCWFMFPGVKGMDDDKPARVMYRASPIVDPDAYTGTRRVFSTREAAEAARRKA